MPPSRLLFLLAGIVFASSEAVVPTPAIAQVAGQYQASSGLGGSFVPDGREGRGLGGSFLLERSIAPGHWTAPRVYAGGFYSRADANGCDFGADPCSVSSQVGVAGGKLRFVAPLPFVGPFMEIGAGLSVGSVESRVGEHSGFGTLDESRSGIMLHVPFSLGLAFGSRRQHDLSFDYFYYPGVDHVSGSLSVGIGFTIR